MSERCTGLKNLVHSRFTNKTILYNEIRYFNVYRIASFKLARFRKCPRIWFLPASVNRLDFCLRTSADMTFVSKRQQMSAEFSFVIFCVAFVPGKLLVVSRLCFCKQMSANVSIFVFVIKCKKICWLSAHVSKFVFCQQVSAKGRWRRHTQFSTSPTCNKNDVCLRPARTCPSFTTKSLLPDLSVSDLNYFVQLGECQKLV